MTEKEFDLIRAAIKSAYPTFNVMPDVYSIRLWYRMLGDLPYKLCETALFELFATHTYPPQIAEIRQKCAEYTKPEIKDEGEAWGEVQKAISQYGYYREEEALASLSEPVRKAVQRLGFRDICLDENEVATRAHFFKIYNAIVEREKTDMQIPAGILEIKREYIRQIEQKESADRIAEKKPDNSETEVKQADPEYIDRLMREHGFRE